MIIFLIVCTQVNSGYNCLPVQRMPSLQVCDAVARQYRAATHGYANTQCLTIRSKS
jgi:hypothetical protein